MKVADVNADIPKGKLPKALIISIFMAIIAAAAGFFVTYREMIPFPQTYSSEGNSGHGTSQAEPQADVVFVELPPLLVPMGNLLSNQYLRFRAELEVTPEYQGEVVTLIPRIVDVLNGYLRALDREDLEKPAALILLRSNMLRRVQTVVGEGRVSSILIMEFVVN